MLYDYQLISDTYKCEKLWTRRPTQESGETYPFMVRWAGYSRCLAGWKFERARSDIFGVEYISFGNAAFVQDGREYVVYPGEVFLLRRDVHHRYSPGPAKILLKRFICIDGIELDNILQYLNLWDKDRIVLSEPSRFEKLLKQITFLVSQPAIPDLGIELSVLTYRLLLILSQSVPVDFPFVIEKALEFMNANLHRSLSRKDICDNVGMSAHQFNRIFSEHMRCSPISYFINQKMHRSANMIKTTAISIKEIAHIMGFEDPLYFSSQFKKYFGLSPKAYRESKME